MAHVRYATGAGVTGPKFLALTVSFTPLKAVVDGWWEGFDMEDQQFLAALEDGTLSLAAFGHRAHLRAGFLYLAKHDFPGACVAMKRAIVGFADRHGKADLYHETLTVAYLALLAERRADEATTIGFDDFIGRYPELEDINYFRRYYPTGSLDYPDARSTFLLPRPRD